MDGVGGEKKYCTSCKMKDFGVVAKFTEPTPGVGHCHASWSVLDSTHSEMDLKAGAPSNSKRRAAIES